MFFVLKSLRKVYKLVISETAISSIALGFTLGVILGLTPLLAWHNLPLLVLVLMFRINLSAVLASMGFFKVAAIPLWGTFNELGASLLGEDSLNGLWTTCVNTPGLSLLQLNNSQVLGSLLVSLCLAPVVLVASVFVVRWARSVLTEQRQNHWLAKILARSRIFAKLTKWAADA